MYNIYNIYIIIYEWKIFQLAMLDSWKVSTLDEFGAPHDQTAD